ncbi:MAG TPA: dihydrolipoamide acetyltransferase family protein [Steroidobacteraceae bacterium]|nr:dihydrolipoamide acetyltransferase family protein [Steroidobacteraceae bacterium]
MDVLMPQLGETVDNGTVVAWFRRIGESVREGDPLFELETEKVTTEIPAPADGLLTEILVEAGQNVRVGSKLAVISAEAPPPGPVVETCNPQSRRKLSPVVRRLLAENSLELKDVTGTGRDGRVTRSDVLSKIEARAIEAPRPSASGGEERVSASAEVEVVPFTALRRRIADHMVRSKAASPHVLQAIEADFHTIERVRERHAREWKQAEGFSLTYLPFIARAVCLILQEFPRLNASVESDRLLLYRQVNLAIAVDVNREGLLAPVIKRAADLTVRQLAQDIHRVSMRTRGNQLLPDELTEGTYTISNSGSFGTFLTAPIINQPQVAILSTDGIRKKAVVIEGEDGDAIAIRPMGILAQSFDHRAVDGAYSASFLKRLRECIEGSHWSLDS